MPPGKRALFLPISFVTIIIAHLHSPNTVHPMPGLSDNRLVIKKIISLGNETTPLHSLTPHVFLPLVVPAFLARLPVNVPNNATCTFRFSPPEHLLLF